MFIVSVCENGNLRSYVSSLSWKLFSFPNAKNEVWCECVISAKKLSVGRKLFVLFIFIIKKVCRSSWICILTMLMPYILYEQSTSVADRASQTSNFDRRNALSHKTGASYPERFNRRNRLQKLLVVHARSPVKLARKRKLICKRSWAADGVLIIGYITVEI